MRALFIGGTGTISTDITMLCIEGGWDVTLLNRGRQSWRLPKDLPITHWAMDINDEEAVSAQLADAPGFDVVVNFINYTVDQIERDIRLFAGRTKQYIFISTASAYQKPRSHYLVTESTPLSNPHWAYSRYKIACEDRLMAEYRHNGFPITIVRPSHTYDQYKLPICIHGGKGSWSTIKRMLDGKPVLVIGDGTSLWPMTFSWDFALGFIGLMGNISAIGEAVHITTDECLSWNQIYQAIGNALGVTPRLAHVATDFIVACRPSYEGPLHGDKSVSVVFDNSKIKRLVPGFAAVVRFDQGVRASVKYLLTHPEAQVEDPDFDRFCDAVIAAQEAAVKQVQAALG